MKINFPSNGCSGVEARGLWQEQTGHEIKNLLDALAAVWRVATADRKQIGTICSVLDRLASTSLLRYARLIGIRQSLTYFHLTDTDCTNEDL